MKVKLQFYQDGSTVLTLIPAPVILADGQPPNIKMLVHMGERKRIDAPDVWHHAPRNTPMLKPYKTPEYDTALENPAGWAAVKSNISDYLTYHGCFFSTTT